ncbi:MAG: alpha/beta fold hydrolase [Phycisphaerae bacterium]
MSSILSNFLTPLFLTIPLVLQTDGAVERFAYDSGRPAIGTWQGTLSMPNASPRFVQVVIERGHSGSLAVGFPQFSSRSPQTTCTDVSASSRSIAFRCMTGNQPADFRGDVSLDGQELVGRVLVGSDSDDDVGQGVFTLRRALRPVDLPGVRVFAGHAKHAGGLSTDMALTIATTPGGNSVGTVDIPMLGIRDFPLVEIVWEDNKFRAKLPSSRPSTIEGEFDADEKRFTGEFAQGELRFTIDFRHDPNYLYRQVARPQHPKPPYPYQSREVVAQHPNGHTLAGTLTLPNEKQFGPGPYPAAVLITGGGQEDRDYTSLGHKPFLVIADFLTRKGIAVMRFDDRGVGASKTTDHTPVGKNSTSYENATDTAAVVRRLRELSEIDPARIGLIGHSEGGLIAPLVYGMDDQIAFIVLLAAPGVKGDEVFRKQLELSWEAQGLDQAMVTKLSAAFVRFSRLIVAGAPREQIDRSIAALAELHVQSALPEGTERAEELATLIKEYDVFVSPWWRYIFGYDPQPVLAAIKCPVLAVNGMKDVQVWQAQNLPAIERAIRAAGGDITTRPYEQLNHALQPAKTGQRDEYARIEITIDERVLRDMAQWLSTKLVISPR